MDTNGSYWKAFEITGGVREYLDYIKALRAGQNALPPPSGEEYADGNAGPGAPGGESGGV